jgi:homospermidine synthase
LSTYKKTPFTGKILVLGCGSVSQCTFPLLARHLDMPMNKITVMDFMDEREKIIEVLKAGVNFEQGKVTRENMENILRKYVGPRDILIDLSWNIDALTIIRWCHENEVRYINSSVELWDPCNNIEFKSPYERSLYFRQMGLRKLKIELESKNNSNPTIIVDHGANPGLVSHFTKRALLEIGSEMLRRNIRSALNLDNKEFEKIIADAEAEKTGAFAQLSYATGTKVIHISERDTQITDKPKEVGEFVNTWSIEGFYEEGTAPAELGWGTHERRLPEHAYFPDGGPGNQIYIAQPGIRTYVYSWVPLGGQIIGHVIRHAEAFTISDYLTVWEDAPKEIRRPIYRPTVHYAYMPCDNAILSLYELAMRSYQLQNRLRIMTDEITDGMDELGVLLLGHGLNGWWTGSQLDIHESRKLVPGQNATTLQVAAAVLAGVIWMINNPTRGILVPDDLPYREILEVALPYLGQCPSVETDWTPLKNRSEIFDLWGKMLPTVEDVWQFSSFLVD